LISIRDLRQKKLLTILLLVLATVVMRRGKKSGHWCGSTWAALVLVHRTSTLLTNVHCILNPSGPSIGLPIQDCRFRPVDYTVFVACVLSQSWFVLFWQTGETLISLWMVYLTLPPLLSCVHWVLSQTSSLSHLRKSFHSCCSMKKHLGFMFQWYLSRLWESYSCIRKTNERKKKSRIVCTKFRASHLHYVEWRPRCVRHVQERNASTHCVPAMRPTSVMK